MIAVAITRQQWRDLMRLTGTEEIFTSVASVHGANFDVEGERFENRALIEAVLAPWFARRTAATVLEEARGTRVMLGEFRSPSEVVDAFHRGEESRVLTEVEHPGLGQMLAATSPLRWNCNYATAKPAPEFGHHTEWALAELLDLSHAEIGRLAAEGTVTLG